MYIKIRCDFDTFGPDVYICTHTHTHTHTHRQYIYIYIYATVRQSYLLKNVCNFNTISTEIIDFSYITLCLLYIIIVLNEIWILYTLKMLD